MKFLLVIAFVVTGLTSFAQKKINFSSQNYVGLLEGESGSKFQLQSINGVTYKTWFAGLGTGIDWYFRRSVPLFASVSREFLHRRNRSFFATADAGINFAWQKANYKNVWGYNETKSYPGAYWNGGLGYKIGIGKGSDALLIQLGYSYKHIGEKVQYGDVIVFDDPLPPRDRFDYHLRRCSIKIGWNL